MKNRTLLIAVVTLSLTSFLSADVKLPAIIGSNMALQQNADIKIWGWAEPAEKITVQPSWQKEAVTIAADEHGRWCVTLKTGTAGGGHALTIHGANTITLDNILFGEVWLCSGQSNMEMSMQGWDNQPVEGGPEAIAASANPSIRLFTVRLDCAEQPREDTVGQWVECSPETVQKFSATGYFFGRKIHQETGLPVGLICSAYGGTVAQAWTRIEYLKYDDKLKSIIDMYDARYNEWQAACQQAEKEQQPKPNRLKFGLIRAQDKPASLYNAMIAPIINVTLRGVIWYQGESNADVAYVYRDLFPTMIKNWRCDFNNLNMPFYFVQLANYTKHKPEGQVDPYRGQPRDDKWAELRQAQFMTNAFKHNGMAVTIDIGQTNCIHPANKQEVGCRLARWALANEYGKDIDRSGPLYAGCRIEGDTIRILFDEAENGLMFKDGKAKGFAIAGADRQFVWADAKIDGTTVIVSSDAVKEPVSVRYAWDADPENSLYDNSGLPASPFRTDNWHGVTFGAL